MEKDLVICQICGNKFRHINNTHLKYNHKITTEEYKKQFPNAKLMCEELLDFRQKILIKTNDKGVKKYSMKMKSLKGKNIKLEAIDNLDLSEEPENFVVCRLCGNNFHRIHWMHLITKHGISPKIYRENFPNAPIESLCFRNKVSKSLKKLYEDSEEFCNRLYKQGFAGRDDMDELASIGHSALVEKYGRDTVIGWGINALKKYNKENPPALRLRRLYKYKDKTFRSKEEIECYKFLKKLGINFIYEYPVGTRLIDFFIEEKLFWEHHPINGLDVLSPDEYAIQRRNVLDENGFKDFPLIITQSLDELYKVEEIIN